MGQGGAAQGGGSADALRFFFSVTLSGHLLAPGWLTGFPDGSLVRLHC